MTAFDDAPDELQQYVSEFWPEREWDHAVSIAQLESGWNAFAEADTTTPEAPCGTVLRTQAGLVVTAEHSIGWFQINACNLPASWKWYHLFNTRHNCGTAHMLWQAAGESWMPWYFSAGKLGLLDTEIPAGQSVFHMRHIPLGALIRAAAWEYKPMQMTVEPASVREQLADEQNPERTV